MTVDGAPNTVTSALTNSTLALLLSDEGTSEGTTSDGVIPVLARLTMPVANDTCERKC